MHIERINLQNFRSFGPEGQSIAVDPDLTTLVGANGAGKTVLMQALQRMFGISNEQRTIRRQDFHIPSLEEEIPSKRTLTLEAIVAFP
ncbi:AAA family ATPase [Proteus mirabilis]